MTHSAEPVPYLPLSAWPRGLWQALLGAWCLFWLLLISVAVQDNWDKPGVLWWQPLLWEGSAALAGTLLMLAMLRYGVHQQGWLSTPWRWFWQHLKWLPLISTLYIVLIYGLRHAIYALADLHYNHLPWLSLWFYETLKLGLFMALWLGVLFGLHSFLAGRDQQLRLQAMQQALSEAKLQQLKAQLQPHFLFNTLNTISAFMHSDVERADRLLTQLADLLRASLTLGEHDTVPLAEELQLLRLYAAIMSERFAPRVQIDWQIAGDTLQVALPTLLLQPLLENAFKHGVECASGLTRIEIASHREAGKVHIRVSNTRPDSRMEGRARSTGVGLRNCRERLQTIYGERARLRLQAHAERFDVLLELPEMRP